MAGQRCGRSTTVSVGKHAAAPLETWFVRARGVRLPALGGWSVRALRIGVRPRKDGAVVAGRVLIARPRCLWRNSRIARRVCAIRQHVGTRMPSALHPVPICLSLIAERSRESDVAIRSDPASTPARGAPTPSTGSASRSASSASGWSADRRSCTWTPRPRHNENVLPHLLSRDENVRAAVASGQFTLRQAEEAHRGDLPNRGGRSAMIIAEHDQALAEGFAGLCLIREMVSAIDQAHEE